MVTDAAWADVDNDGFSDLITVGDWQPIRIFINQAGKGLINIKDLTQQNSSGMWNSIAVADLDNDGDLDFVAGNHGKNSFLKPRLKMYVGDLDGNGTPEQIICEESQGKFYPIAEIDELIKQIPSLKKKAILYSDFAKLSIDQLFTKAQLAKALILEANQLTSTVFINNNGSFKPVDLPIEAQFSPIYAIMIDDLNDDGYQDLILGGNQYLVKPQFGRFDASKGLVILGSKEGFKSENALFLDINGQIRDIQSIFVGNRKLILFAINDGPIEIYEIQK
jgi:hypothetical protein